MTRATPILSPFQADEPSDPLQAAAQARDRDLLSIVRDALAAGNARLAFQPIVAAQQGRKVAFYEGLIRVHDAQGRVLPAGQFMDQIEEHELGREIDCASLRLGIEMLRANPSLRLAVNMSARSMADGKWRDTLTRGLFKQPELGARLILEISEASAMQLHEVLIRFMAEVQPLGVAFSLDDFGAGQTAFRHLKDFYFDMVKIDRGFVRDADSNPDGQVMAGALIAVAHQLEMFAIAEGVETEGEARVLTDLGADCLQGYLFGVPKFRL